LANLTQLHGEGKNLAIHLGLLVVSILFIKNDNTTQQKKNPAGL
jgi:hypothetical protein